MPPVDPLRMPILDAAAKPLALESLHCAAQPSLDRVVAAAAQFTIVLAQYVVNGGGVAGVFGIVDDENYEKRLHVEKSGLRTGRWIGYQSGCKG